MTIRFGLTETQGLRCCLFVLLSCFFFFISACKQDYELKHTANPSAEFDPQESTFICWTPQFQEISLKLIQEIAEVDHVTLFYNQRNQQPEALQKLFRQRKINLKNVIWLKKGIPQDDLFDNGSVIDNIYGNGVHWHVDEFCRFADVQTTLLAQVDPADLALDPFYQVVHERLEESYQILKNASDQDGNPFKIIRVPQAPIIFDQGNYKGQAIFYTPVTSYLNFVLTNNLVVIPAYYNPGDPDFIRQKDEQARKAFQEVFHSRKVVMINATELNYKGGGLHCITMHKPKIEKPSNLRVKWNNTLKRWKG